jgi:DNA-binding FadR family transcriptional regulator
MKMSREIFSSITTRRASEEISTQIKTAIFSDQLKTGDRLPSEMELAEIFNTSRTTVREGLKALEKEGFLIIKQGIKGGSYIREADFSPVVNSITHMLMLKKITLGNLTQARLIIEPEISKIAAVKAGRHEIKRMGEALDGLRKVVENEERSTATNIQFHRIISESCKNPALYFINDSLLNILQENLSKLYMKLESNRFLLEQHIQIYEAIKARNRERAYLEMRKHILTVQRIMKKR